VTRTAFPLGGLVWLALASHLCGCGGDPSGPAEDDPPPIVPCYHADFRCWEQLSLGTNMLLPLYRTHPIKGTDTTVVRAIIVVHGAGRTADSSFRTMVEAVFLAGKKEGTLVISPHFQTEEDGPDPAELTWTSGGWKRGHLSLERAGASGRISSYEAVDRVIQFLSDPLRFPKLESVVVAGHSAGGQYAHRFAATSPIEVLKGHIRFRYVVANPSTYLYLRPERAIPEGGGFALPDRLACHDYNYWHYGFEDRNSYALRLTEEGIRERLVGRDVAYLLGTADTGDEQLDMSCGAMLQGRHRYARGLALFAFLNTFYPQHGHQLFEIAGVAHSSSGIYKSEIGREVLFEW
jgi:pimeloyl-ACP methyl ester carboxylesterase